jgi:hypothetical protein
MFRLSFPHLSLSPLSSLPLSLSPSLPLPSLPIRHPALPAGRVRIAQRVQILKSQSSIAALASNHGSVGLF